MAYRIVLRLDTKEWNSDGKHGVGGSGVPIVSSLGRIAPSRALQGSVGRQENLSGVY